MKKLSILVIILSFLAVFLLVPAASTSAQVDPLKEACSNAEGNTGNKSDICNTPATDPLTGQNGDGIIIKAANLIAMITGVAAVIIIIVAGLQYITAAGEPNKVSNAKQAIIFALVGLAIVLIARTIVAFIIRRI